MHLLQDLADSGRTGAMDTVKSDPSLDARSKEHGS